MATKKETTRDYCDDVFAELSQMQKRLLALPGELAAVYGEKSALYLKFERYMNELADQLAWRLQVLSHSCTQNGKGRIKGAAGGVRIDQADNSAKRDISPEYAGK
ncbi:MAG: hypothetical protein M0042_14235 [Nitrospiraceae bacterium]|nr:hypothetical protein [Nitrospiraceae bacterium]